jgi:hypothetical protein
MTASASARGQARPARRSALVRLPLLLTLCVGAWVFWQSQRLIRADFASVAAR